MVPALLKRAFKYRFYRPTRRAADCRARRVRAEGLQPGAGRPHRRWTLRQERVTYNQTLGVAHRLEEDRELAYLTEVRSVPLSSACGNLAGRVHQLLRQAARYPRFNRGRSPAGARSTRPARSAPRRHAHPGQDDRTPDIVWRVPSHRRDALDGDREPGRAGRWFVSLLCEDPSVTPLPAAASVRWGVDAGWITC